MKALRAILIILIIAVIGGFAYWYSTTRMATPAKTTITGSGTVETTQVIISPELSGKIVEVLVSEGDSVKMGDTLFKLDDTLLNAQLNQAQANLAAAQAGLDVANTALSAAGAGVSTAQAQYDLSLATARLQAQPTQSAAWSQSSPPEFNQPVYYFTHAEEISATLKEVSAASDALAAAQAGFNSLISSGVYTDLVSIESRLAQAQVAFLNASDVRDQANAQDDSTLIDQAQQDYDAAKSELDAAQQAYDQQLSTQEATDILQARAKLAATQRRYDEALDRYYGQLTGADSLAVKVASNAVAQARANLTAAQSKVEQAQKGIDQAQSAIGLINVQLAKLVVSAPVDGVVLARNIEPGELAISGATALTLGQLNSLTITVYIPENRYGEIKLGDKASVNVDSFPAALFIATVTRIADQAEFTPRNVQTAEGRQSTVFAVELAVDNPAGLLKPGMPADVTFIR